MIAFRRRHRVLRTEDFYQDQDIFWFGPAGNAPNWGDGSRTQGCIIRPQPSPPAAGQESVALGVLFNADVSETKFRLPVPPGNKGWYMAVDTAKPSPRDICSAGQEELLGRQDSYRMQPRSMVILISP